MNPLAVIDVETTGPNPHAMIGWVEVAVVLMVPGRGFMQEMTTLVNPERDVGPTSIHGLTASDLLDAPRFADIAANLTELLCASAALVGHNVRFRHLVLAVGVQAYRRQYAGVYGSRYDAPCAAELLRHAAQRTA